MMKQVALIVSCADAMPERKVRPVKHGWQQRELLVLATNALHDIRILVQH